MKRPCIHTTIAILNPECPPPHGAPVKLMRRSTGRNSQAPSPIARQQPKRVRPQTARTSRLYRKQQSHHPHRLYQLPRFLPLSTPGCPGTDHQPTTPAATQKGLSPNALHRPVIPQRPTSAFKSLIPITPLVPLSPPGCRGTDHRPNKPAATQNGPSPNRPAPPVYTENNNLSIHTGYTNHTIRPPTPTPATQG